MNDTDASFVRLREHREHIVLGRKGEKRSPHGETSPAFRIVRRSNNANGARANSPRPPSRRQFFALTGRAKVRRSTLPLLAGVAFDERWPLIWRTTMREKIRLVSTAGTGFFYTTTKNRRNTPEKMVIKKYDPKVRKHVEFKEAKIK